MPNMLNSSTALDAVRISFLEWLFKQETGKQAAISAYREYYDGEHDAQLTDRQAAYLQLKSSEEEFNANYCPIVVDSMAERLVVTGFTAEGQDEELWDWWLASKNDAQAGIVHTAAVRDGESFVIVSYDDDEGRPVFTYEPYCVNGVGVKLHYDMERRGVPAFASKRWRVEAGPDSGKKRRLNLYYPDRIEKYVSHGEYESGAWQEYTSDDNPVWPIPWTVDGTEGGEPLGIPVFHFRNRDQGDDGGTSELRDVVPMQNALNKTIIDLLAAADSSGFGLLTLTGDEPPQGMEIAPGGMLYASKPEAKYGRLQGDDLSGLITLKDSVAVEIARISRTPLSNFQISKQRAAEGTLKQEQAGLVSKIEKAQVGFGNEWEAAMQMARRLHNVFRKNGKDTAPKLSEDVAIEAVWADAEVRNDKEQLEELKLKAELGIPLEFLWREAGYSAAAIEEMKKTEEYQARLAGMSLLQQDSDDLDEAEDG